VPKTGVHFRRRVGRLQGKVDYNFPTWNTRFSTVFHSLSTTGALYGRRAGTAAFRLGTAHSEQGNEGLECVFSSVFSGMVKALKNNRLKGWHVASLHEEAARSGSASSVTCASPASGSHPCSARYLFTYVQGSGETSRRRRSMGTQASYVRIFRCPESAQRF